MTAFEDIRRVVGTYLDALYDCDSRKLGTVFHPRAIYATADEPVPLYRDMEAYFPVVAARQSPASRNEVRSEAIDEIQLAGENTAFARVRCRFGGRDFVDFLSFVREEGRWLIIAKVFHFIER